LWVGQERHGDMGEAQEQRHLAKAEADVANADDRIERQRAIVAKLKNDGHPTDTAEKIWRRCCALAMRWKRTAGSSSKHSHSIMWTELAHPLPRPRTSPYRLPAGTVGASRVAVDAR